MEETETLIVGGGPFGLALAAHLTSAGLDYLLLGREMGFWRDNMPNGMLLRSGRDWHLDTRGIHTLDAFAALHERGSVANEPLSRDFYLDYVNWFVDKSGVNLDPTEVEQLDRLEEASGFVAKLTDGRVIRARRVVLALGFAYSEHVPADLEARLPAGRFVHTCDFTDFDAVAGRILIVGGRQSAFEWAALLREAGAAAVHVVYRHPTPEFAAADWSWVSPLVDSMVADPGWYRRLPISEKDEVGRRLWAEGRLKVEPWLEHRVVRDGITLWPEANVTSTEVQPDGTIEARLDSGSSLIADQVVLATGYKSMITNVPMLARGNILPALPMKNGCPVLDETFQTGLPGLFMTSMAAVADFGPFFAFTVAVRASAEVIGRSLGVRNPSQVLSNSPAVS